MWSTESKRWFVSTENSQCKTWWYFKPLAITVLEYVLYNYGHVRFSEGFWGSLRVSHLLTGSSRWSLPESSECWSWRSCRCSSSGVRAPWKPAGLGCCETGKRWLEGLSELVCVWVCVSVCAHVCVRVCVYIPGSDEVRTRPRAQTSRSVPRWVLSNQCRRYRGRPLRNLKPKKISDVILDMKSFYRTQIICSFYKQYQQNSDHQRCRSNQRNTNPKPWVERPLPVSARSCGRICLLGSWREVEAWVSLRWGPSSAGASGAGGATDSPGKLRRPGKTDHAETASPSSRNRETSPRPSEPSAEPTVQQSTSDMC